MDWEIAEQVLFKMSSVYAQDNLRKLTFNAEIYPLLLRFQNEERTQELYDSIFKIEKALMKNINQDTDDDRFL